MIVLKHVTDDCQCEGKTCKACETHQCLEAFSPDKTGKQGRQSRCKACRNKSKQNYRTTHRERENQQNRDRYHKDIEHTRQMSREQYQRNIDRERQCRNEYYRNNTERIQQIQLKYNTVHLEEKRLRGREHYANNTEYYRVKRQRWEKSNPAKSRAKNARRHARERNAAIHPVDYKAILERYGYICHICGQEINSADGQSLHFDHVIPLIRGGAHSEENIRPSHSVCNLRKNDRLLEEMTPFQRRGPS